MIIAGAGHAGSAVAGELRAAGFTGTILLVGDEPRLPYQRPPLSKGWLTASPDPEALELRPAAFYAQERIDLLLGSRAEKVEPAANLLRLADGTELTWRHLVLATGAGPRVPRLPGVGLDGVHVLRDMDDATLLKAALESGQRLVVIGGGWVGLEVAASARARGVRVTVLEARPRLLARTAGPTVAACLERHHLSRGVDIRTGAQAERLFAGPDGRVGAVRLADGSCLDCDAVLLAVGAVPRDALARAAGLVCRDGVLVDAQGATDAPGVYAVGDVTVRPLAGESFSGRLESIQSAHEQARRTAAAICGRPQRPLETPWFWSEQYELRIQIAGLPLEAGTSVLRGEPDGPGFAVFHLRGDRLRAVEAVSAPREFALGRKLIGEGARVLASALGDQTRPLREAVLGHG